MDNEKKLKEINREIKSYINEAVFVSNQCRNKIIKLLGDEFSINLPLENFKTIDVILNEDGSIIMRGDKYDQKDKLTFSEVEDKYNNFKLKADSILKKKEINYYNKGDYNNIKNLIIVLLIVVIFISLLIYAIQSLLVGDFINCLWLIAFSSTWLIPKFDIGSRFRQAFNYIKKKTRK